VVVAEGLRMYLCLHEHHANCLSVTAPCRIRVGTYGTGPGSKPVHRVIYAPPPPPAPPGCVDDNKLCHVWAEEGECVTNPGYMVGTQEQPGACLKSCQRCDLMPKAEGTKGLNQ
jgi:hypothetical protein